MATTNIEHRQTHSQININVLTNGLGTSVLGYLIHVHLVAKKRRRRKKKETMQASEPDSDMTQMSEVSGNLK